MVHPVQPASHLPHFKKITPVTAADMALRSAQASFQAHHWPQAIAHAQRAIQLQPSATAYKLLGDARLHQQQWQAAKIAYQQALTLQPDSAEIYANLGTLAAHQQQWSTALQSFRQAIALKPELAATLQPNLEQLWTQIEQLALHVFFDQPDQFEAIDHQMLGDRLLKREQAEAAVRCYDVAITIDPTLATAFWNLSLAQKQLGNSDAMMNSYFQALCLQPDWATAEEHCKLGNHFLQQEEWQQAIDCYERAIEQDAALADAHFGLGTALQKTGKLDGAIEAYQRSIEFQPNHFWSHQYLGDVLMRLERWQAAVVAYQGAIALDSQFHWSHYNLGEALAKLGQWDGAIEAYRWAIKLKPKLVQAHRNLGEILQQRAKENLQALHNAVELRPNDANLYVELGDLLAHQGETEKAVVFYQIAKQLLPNNVELQLKIEKISSTMQTGFEDEAVRSQADTIDFYAGILFSSIPSKNNEKIQNHLDCNFVDSNIQTRISSITCSVDIVVCVHNALEDVQACLASVVCHRASNHSIIIVDDGSEVDTKLFLQQWVIQTPLTTLFRNEKAQGYTKAANIGLRASSAEYVVLLNSDTIVSPQWAEKMIECARSDSQIGIVGPLSNCATWQSVPDVFDQGTDWKINKIPEGFSVDSLSQLIEELSERTFPKVDFLNGFCYMISRSVLDIVGLLDEDSFPQGYGEENDFSIRAAKAGFKLAIADHAYVYHSKSKSFGHARRKTLSKAGSEALRRKHPAIDIKARAEKSRYISALDRLRSRIRATLDEVI